MAAAPCAFAVRSDPCCHTEMGLEAAKRSASHPCGCCTMLLCAPPHVGTAASCPCAACPCGCCTQLPCAPHPAAGAPHLALCLSRAALQLAPVLHNLQRQRAQLAHVSFERLVVRPKRPDRQAGNARPGGGEQGGCRCVGCRARLSAGQCTASGGCRMWRSPTCTHVKQDSI